MIANKNSHINDARSRGVGYIAICVASIITLASGTVITIIAATPVRKSLNINYIITLGVTLGISVLSVLLAVSILLIRQQKLYYSGEDLKAKKHSLDHSVHAIAICDSIADMSWHMYRQLQQLKCGDIKQALQDGCLRIECTPSQSIINPKHLSKAVNFSKAIAITSISLIIAGSIAITTLAILNYKLNNVVSNNVMIVLAAPYIVLVLSLITCFIYNIKNVVYADLVKYNCGDAHLLAPHYHVDICTTLHKQPMDNNQNPTFITSKRFCFSRDKFNLEVENLKAGRAMILGIPVSNITAQWAPTITCELHPEVVFELDCKAIKLNITPDHTQPKNKKPITDDLDYINDSAINFKPKPIWTTYKCKDEISSEDLKQFKIDPETADPSIVLLPLALYLQPSEQMFEGRTPESDIGKALNTVLMVWGKGYHQAQPATYTIDSTILEVVAATAVKATKLPYASDADCNVTNKHLIEDATLLSELPEIKDKKLITIHNTIDEQSGTATVCLKVDLQGLKQHFLTKYTPGVVAAQYRIHLTLNTHVRDSLQVVDCYKNNAAACNQYVREQATTPRSTLQRHKSIHATCLTALDTMTPELVNTHTVTTNSAFYMTMQRYNRVLFECHNNVQLFLDTAQTSRKLAIGDTTQDNHPKHSNQEALNALGNLMCLIEDLLFDNNIDGVTIELIATTTPSLHCIRFTAPDTTTCLALPIGIDQYNTMLRNLTLAQEILSDQLLSTIGIFEENFNFQYDNTKTDSSSQCVEHYTGNSLIARFTIPSLSKFCTSLSIVNPVPETRIFNCKLQYTNDWHTALIHATTQDSEQDGENILPQDNVDKVCYTANSNRSPEKVTIATAQVLYVLNDTYNPNSETRFEFHYDHNSTNNKLTLEAFSALKQALVSVSPTLEAMQSNSLTYNETFPNSSTCIIRGSYHLAKLESDLNANAQTIANTLTESATLNASVNKTTLVKTGGSPKVTAASSDVQIAAEPSLTFTQVSDAYANATQQIILDISHLGGDKAVAIRTEGSQRHLVVVEESGYYENITKCVDFLLAMYDGPGYTSNTQEKQNLYSIQALIGKMTDTASASNKAISVTFYTQENTSQSSNAAIKQQCTQQYITHLKSLLSTNISAKYHTGMTYEEHKDAVTLTILPKTFAQYYAGGAYEDFCKLRNLRLDRMRTSNTASKPDSKPEESTLAWYMQMDIHPSNIVHLTHYKAMCATFTHHTQYKPEEKTQYLIPIAAYIFKQLIEEILAQESDRDRSIMQEIQEFTEAQIGKTAAIIQTLQRPKSRPFAQHQRACKKFAKAIRNTVQDTVVTHTCNTDYLKTSFDIALTQEDMKELKALMLRTVVTLKEKVENNDNCAITLELQELNANNGFLIKYNPCNTDKQHLAQLMSYSNAQHCIDHTLTIQSVTQTTTEPAVMSSGTSNATQGNPSQAITECSSENVSATIPQSSKKSTLITQ